ncbi:MAG: radical SAM protein [Alphaproteobacteria bacterium]|nr:radical SAM protein [Alphaproteobacteria bacterium]
MSQPALHAPVTLDGNQPHNPDRDRRKNVEINIGKACNNRCVFCIDGLPKREDRSYMPWPAMQRELERYHADGYRSVGFLGGEPTTYPKICDSVAYARELGFTRIAIATNATKLRLPHFTDRILDAGLTRVTISMHGHTAELEDKLTRVPGNFEKKVAAIRYLKHKQQTEGHLPDGLSVNIVLNGWNYRHLPKMMQFFYDRMGLDDLRINFIRPEGYAEGDADLTPRYPDVVPYLVKAIVLNEHHFQKTFTFGGFPMCVLPRQLRGSETLLRKYMGEYRDLSTACSIRSGGGDVIPPGKVPPGQGRGKQYPSTVVEFSAAEQRARFNWQDRKRHDLKDQPDACLRCKLEPVCEGVWKGYLDIWGDGEFQPVP